MNQLFQKQSYYKNTFKNIITSNSTIQNIEFEECLFSKINLTNCKIEKCRFLNCKFENSVLSAIKPVNSTFNIVMFNECKALGFDWTLAVKIESLAFSNCQIDYSNFRFLYLPNLKLINCVAKEADFTEADLEGADFTGTDFERSRFFKTNLPKVNFQKAKNYLIDIKNNNIRKAQFSYPDVLGLLNNLDIKIEY